MAFFYMKRVVASKNLKSSFFLFANNYWYIMYIGKFFLFCNYCDYFCWFVSIFIYDIVLMLFLRMFVFTSCYMTYSEFSVEKWKRSDLRMRIEILSHRYPVFCSVFT